MQLQKKEEKKKSSILLDMADWSLIACMDDMHDEEQPTIKNMSGNFKSHALTDGASGFRESARLTVVSVSQSFH